jgi:hypothetical protein
MTIKKKVERYKPPAVDNIAAGFIHAGGRKIHSEIHKLINSLWNREELTQPIYKQDDKT